MHTVMTTNDGYDSILLVDDNWLVVSAWQAEPETVTMFVRDGAEPSDWNTDEWYGFQNPVMTENEDELRTIEAYGTECGRDGIITDERRKEFWFRD